MDLPEVKRGGEAAPDKREKAGIVGIGVGEVGLCLSLDTAGIFLETKGASRT